MAGDLNQAIIEEFRANGGNVGGKFEGTPLLLLHSIGAKSGKTRINPMMYQDLGDGLAVFASKGAAPTNPDWYHNLVANARATVEVGAETFAVTARVAHGDERERIWATQGALSGLRPLRAKDEARDPVIILERVAQGKPPTRNEQALSA